MAQELITWKASYDGTTLRREHEARRTAGDLWRRGAAFLVHEDSFELFVKVPDVPEGETCANFKLGIAFRDAKSLVKSLADLRSNDGPGFELFVCSYVNNESRPGIHIKTGTNWDGPTEQTRLSNLPPIQPGAIIRMHFTTSPVNQLSIAVSGSDPIVLNEHPYVMARGLQVFPDKPYAPFVKLGVATSLETKVTTRDRSLSKKRRLDQADSHIQRMWQDREFTDAEIVTSSGSILVHRTILCSLASFKAALMGGYQESIACKIRIDDVSHRSVEAFIQFLYIGALPDEVNLAEVLKLAHRYEKHDLVDVCVGLLLQAVSAETVCETVRFLRPLKDHSSVASAWEKLCEKIAKRSELQNSIMMVV